MSENDKARFLNEKAEFDLTGFFTNTDGIHSSQLEFKSKHITKKFIDTINKNSS